MHPTLRELPNLEPRKLRRWVVGLSVSALLVAGASVGLASPDAPTAGTLDAGPAPNPDGSGPSYVVLPDQNQIGAAAALELRLRALGRELRRSLSPVAVELGADAKEFGVAALSEELTEILGRNESKATISIHVRELATQRVLFDSIGNTPLNPASNQKLLTSAAALDLLGADYTFATEVSLRDNTLYLRGTGDPTLDSDDLRSVAALLVERLDVASIERLVVDDAAFSPRRFGPGYATDGTGEAYQAPSGALSLDFNTVLVTVAPVRKGPRPSVTFEPPSAHVQIENLAWAGRRGGIAVRTRGEPDSTGELTTVIEVHGSMSRRARPVVERRRIEDPGLFAGGAFAQMLADLTASEPIVVERGVVPRDAEVVLVNESAPLIEVLDSGLAYSNNFIAEQVLRTVAWRMTGDPGDWEAGTAILNGYWAALGNDPDHLVVENASGLSREGRLTTTGLVDLISVAYRTAEGHDGLIDALPVAGDAGTLRSRLRRSGRRVRAKTGTLHGVSGLTGVITSEQGEPQVAFSILTNVHEGANMNATARRRLEDRVVMAVLRGVDEYAAL